MSGAPLLAGYHYVGDLGSGYRSDVYLYTQEASGDRFAVKVLRGGVRVDGEEWGRFTDEAAAMPWWAGHSDVLRVRGTGVTTDGFGYMVMPYCPGPHVLDSAGKLPVDDVIGLGMAIAGAVHAAHRAGIVHGNIKPGNILTDSAGIRRLTDFGLLGTLLHVTEGDVPEGTVPWAAPEVLGGVRVSVAADVYSLGATLWHLLVGRSPFEIPGGDNGRAALRARIMAGPAPEVSRADVPETLVFLLSQMMLGDPSQRPASADIVAGTLTRIRKSGALRGGRPDARRPNTPPGAGHRHPAGHGGGLGDDEGEGRGSTRHRGRNRGLAWTWPPRRFG